MGHIGDTGKENGNYYLGFRVSCHMAAVGELKLSYCSRKSYFILSISSLVA